MLMGAALVIAALLLFCFNEREATEADTAAQEMLPEVVAEIEARSAILMEASAVPAEREEMTSPLAAATVPAGAGEAPEPAVEEGGEPTPAAGDIHAAAEPTPAVTIEVDPYDTEMTVVNIKGYDYVGYVSIPEIKIELPVMSEWSYPRLRKAPCRYSGSTKTDDFVILAHNYSRHFGKLKNLSPGDTVIFTDMNGVVAEYAVVEVDTLSPRAVEEMTSGEYDLTLFTCTYGGKSRVTVRCDRVEE